MSATAQTTPETLLETPFTDMHRSAGARIVPFAGYAMPVQYPAGIIAEHTQCRTKAALFDVAHMGVVDLTGPERASALETLLPADVKGLVEGAQTYSFFTNPEAGILDDLMITNLGDRLMLVVNAACKEADIAHLQATLPESAGVAPRPDLALLALQGPASEAALAALAPEAAAMTFMTARTFPIAGVECRVTRSGYTGEDGYEIAIPADQATTVAQALLDQADVEWAGLGARDSLRLEAGLCLYGHDIDTKTTPVEAGLVWAIAKHRRGADAGYPGAAIIAEQITNGPLRKRVGLRPDGRAPAREGADLTDESEMIIGAVTSGGFGPTVGGPVAMGYVSREHAEPGNVVNAMVRGKPLACTVTKMPFVPRGYKRA